MRTCDQEPDAYAEKCDTKKPRRQNVSTGLSLDLTAYADSFLLNGNAPGLAFRCLRNEDV